MNVSQSIGYTSNLIPTISGWEAENKQKIAKEALTFATEWTKIASDKLERQKTRRDRKRQKKECYDYVLANYQPEPKTFALTSIVFWMIFRWVVWWVVSKLLDNMEIET